MKKWYIQKNANDLTRGEKEMYVVIILCTIETTNFQSFLIGNMLNNNYGHDDNNM